MKDIIKQVTIRPPYYPAKWHNEAPLTVNKKRQMIGDRDNWICQLCLLPIEYMYLATLDHITPLSKGGTFNKTNLQIAHQKCNTAKGNSIEVFPPEYYRNFVSIGKKRRSVKREVAKMARKIVEVKPEESKLSQVSELWNELVRHGFKNLSYNLFEQYFERYASVKIRKIGTDLKGKVLCEQIDRPLPHSRT